MGTAYSELQRRVFVGFPRTDGEAILAVRQGINDAIQAIACLEDAKSLLKTDTTSADTADGTKSYHLVTDWNLTRPKDIFSIRVEDSSSTRKLIYVPQPEMDLKIPYPEQNSEDIPKWYVPFGDYVELYPIPDAAYDVLIRYSQFPAALSADADESPYGAEWDHAIVFLGKDIANAYLNGEYVSPAQKAADYVLLSKKARKDPDRKIFARPFNPDGGQTSVTNYWEDPFRRGVR